MSTQPIEEKKEDNGATPETERTYHRPITLYVKAIRPMPHVRTLPQITTMLANLKMEETQCYEMIQEIITQLKAGKTYVFIEVECES